MKSMLYYSEGNSFRKTLQDIEQPNDFQFYYEKKIIQHSSQMSPTSTCPSNGKIKSWFNQFPSRTFKDSQNQENMTAIEFGTISGNLLAGSIQKYSTAVSNYLKQVQGDDSDRIVDFLSVQKLSGLDFQKQQFSRILEKYNEKNKSTQNLQQILHGQNSVFRSFLEEITYLNYEQINYQLLLITNQIYNYKGQYKNQDQSIKEFLFKLSENPRVQYISFKFLNNQFQTSRNRSFYLQFLEKIFQILSELYMHFDIFQNESDQQEDLPQINRNELKLFSSQRDLWDSDDDESEMRISVPTKRIKYSLDQ